MTNLIHTIAYYQDYKVPAIATFHTSIFGNFAAMLCWLCQKWKHLTALHYQITQITNKQDVAF